MLLPHRVVFLSKKCHKNIYIFLRYLRTICPKIFAKLEYFATISQKGVAYFALKVFWPFLTFSQLCFAYTVLKVLANWKKKHNLFRMKDNLAVLAYKQRFSGHNMLIIVTKKKNSDIVLCKTGVTCLQDVYLLLYALF